MRVRSPPSLSDTSPVSPQGVALIRSCAPRLFPPPSQARLQAFPASPSRARPEGPARRPLRPPPARPRPGSLHAGRADPAGPGPALGDGHAARIHRLLQRPLSRPAAFSPPGHRPSSPEAFVRVAGRSRARAAWTRRASVAPPAGTQGACICRACFRALQSRVGRCLRHPEGCVLLEVRACPSLCDKATDAGHSSLCWLRRVSRRVSPCGEWVSGLGVPSEDTHPLFAVCTGGTVIGGTGPITWQSWMKGIVPLFLLMTFNFFCFI